MLRNRSTVTEFILLGFQQSTTSTRALLLALFLALYSLTMAMNDPKLNSPMYFFLSHLSLLDVCFITTTIPQMLIYLVVRNHAVSFCILSAFMAYDRYVAICYPLSYVQIISQNVCVRLVGTAWFSGLINGIFLEYVSFREPFCRDNHIENFFCEAPMVIGLSCGDPQFSLRAIFADAIVELLSPMVLIVTSYVCILATILSRASSSGQGKTLSTSVFSYMNPHSTHGPDKDKPFSLLYTIITPMALGRTRLAPAQSV
uniref:Olfactory receptor family 10 subfamily AD member 1 n=1 Tax=Rhinopithecus roxellana TaxID=61622 RepID=A0A2K6QB86_RHIRO